MTKAKPKRKVALQRAQGHSEPRRRVAVFDIDGTIFRSSLLVELVDNLIVRGIFPKAAAKEYSDAYENWLNRRGEYEDYLWGVIRAFTKNIRGVSYKEIVNLSKQISKIHQERIYRWTRDLIKNLKKKNYYLLAISGSPKFIVEEFSHGLGFDKTYGRRYELDKKGRFTGAVMDEELISDKAKILKRAAGKENLTLRGSVGVGDTETDIPLLKMVAKPICFNPNQKLYKYAKRKGWKVIVERKDVIYKLQRQRL